VQALITFEGGLECCYQATFTSHADRVEWRIECRDAALCWDGGDVLSVLSGGEQRAEIGVDPIPASPEQCILDDWRRYIHEGIEPEISGRNNLDTMSMISAAITSSDEGCTVSIS
jgi:predicted dehydrogenase